MRPVVWAPRERKHKLSRSPFFIIIVVFYLLYKQHLKLQSGAEAERVRCLLLRHVNGLPGHVGSPATLAPW